MTEKPHISVLLQEFLSLFKNRTIKVFIDGTLGAGGHAEGLLSTHPEIQKFIGIDQDKSALEISLKRLQVYDNKLVIVKDNFSNLAKILQKQGVEKVDGILVDIGVSSMQLDQAERGFSFLKDGPLDMRMDQDKLLSAQEIVNTYSEKELADLFYLYSEEKNSRVIAKAIVMDRAKKPFLTTRDLASLMERITKVRERDQHPATRIFQALRIAVNQELDVLTQFIPQAISLLNPGGVLAIMTFHSLEDRIVKQKFQYYASDKESTSGRGGVFLTKQPIVKLLTRKPLSASDEEIAANPRSRSAHLRAVEKL